MAGQILVNLSGLFQRILLISHDFCRYLFQIWSKPDMGKLFFQVHRRLAVQNRFCLRIHIVHMGFIGIFDGIRLSHMMNCMETQGSLGILGIRKGIFFRIRIPPCFLPIAGTSNLHRQQPEIFYLGVFYRNWKIHLHGFVFPLCFFLDAQSAFYMKSAGHTALYFHLSNYLM